jgi:prefoldin subunit 5|tara:strand:+ start:2450 stop:2662 length:213 start_codon:yes stop_codon:yes gene_type:complete
MQNEPVDIGTPYVTREDMQESINELFVRVDELHKAVYNNNNKLADMERSLALFVHLISDKLGVSSGEMND